VSLQRCHRCSSGGGHPWPNGDRYGIKPLGESLLQRLRSMNFIDEFNRRFWGVAIQVLRGGEERGDECVSIPFPRSAHDQKNDNHVFSDQLSEFTNKAYVLKESSCFYCSSFAES